MKKETIEFIETLFEYYADTSSGKESENAEAVRAARQDLEAYKARQVDSERTLAEIYAVVQGEPNIGLWELGGRVIEILSARGYNK